MFLLLEFPQSSHTGSNYVHYGVCNIQGVTLIISNAVKNNSTLSLRSWSVVHHCPVSYFLIWLIIIEIVGCMLCKVYFIYPLIPVQV